VATSTCQFTPNFHTGGHVTPAWNLRRWPARSDTWQASITTWLEAGEQMSDLAADLREFLPMPTPSRYRSPFTWA
jgi:hypothetical protein